MPSASKNKGGTRFHDTAANNIHKAQVILYTPSLTPTDGDWIVRLVYELGYTTEEETHGAPSSDWRVEDAWQWGDPEWNIQANDGARVLLLVDEAGWPTVYASFDAETSRFIDIPTQSGDVISVLCGGTQGDTGYQSLWIGLDFVDQGKFDGVSTEGRPQWFWPIAVGAGFVLTGDNYNHILAESGGNALFLFQTLDNRADYVGGQGGSDGTLIAPISSFVTATADQEVSTLTLSSGDLLRSGHHVLVVRTDSTGGNVVRVVPGGSDVFADGSTYWDLDTGGTVAFYWSGTAWWAVNPVNAVNSLD